MEVLYQVSGMLNRGFVGQITYTICLEQEYSSLDIHFAFDEEKQRYHPEDITDELIRSNITLVREKYGVDRTPDEMRTALLAEGKTELHTLATLDDEFIGCVHKQLTDRHMLYRPGYASEGCIPRETFSGVLKVTILVFNVIKDQTGYSLKVSAGGNSEENRERRAPVTIKHGKGAG